MREHLFEIMHAALDRVATRPAVIRNLPNKPKGKCVIIGAGKASAEMAAAVEEHWPDVNLSGVVATRYGHGAPTQRVRIIEAGHPVPDENSILASEQMLRMLEDVTEEDLVLALISGGGSACLSAPIEGVSLSDLQTLTKALLGSGAPISEMNVIRQSISRIKGGKLGAETIPATLVTLVISDVPGDKLELVASGPTIPPNNATHLAEPSEKIRQYVPELSSHLLAALQSSAAESVKANPNSEHFMIASNAEALEAAATKARELGYQPVVLGDALEGESSDLGCVFATLARTAQKPEFERTRPLALISGGETTVTLTNGDAVGKGGRNQEFLLAFAHHLGPTDNIWALSIDTDGFDGFVDAAGAVFTPNTLKRAEAHNLCAADHLERHDSYSFFQELGDLIKIGATQTNVNDFRVILVQ